MRFDEFANPHRADELHIQLDGGMRLVAGSAERGHAHGLIRECGEHAAVHDIGEVQMFRLDEEAESASPFRQIGPTSSPKPIGLTIFHPARAGSNTAVSVAAGLSFMPAPCLPAPARKAGV